MAGSDGGGPGGQDGSVADAAVDRAGASDAPLDVAAADGALMSPPPASCIPPCIWALIGPCRPAAPCKESAPSSGTIYGCYPDLGITWEKPSYYDQTVYWPDHTICYSVAYALGILEYRSPSGQVVAGARAVTVQGKTIAEAACASGGTFQYDPNAAECDPWTNRHCTVGTCP